MQVHRKRGCLDDMLRMLRDQAGNHSGEDVSSSASRHSRIASRIHPDIAARRRDQRAMAFQNDDHLVFVGKLSCHLYAVGLNGSNGRSCKACHLSGMGRNHERASLAFQFASHAFKSIEGIRIENHWDVIFRHDSAHELRSLGVTRNSRTNRQHTLAFHERREQSGIERTASDGPGLCFFQPFGHEFRMKSSDSRHNRFCGCHGGKPSACSQCREPCHRCGTRLAQRSTDHEHVSVAALVGFS